MSLPDDYISEMPATRLEDHEIERLLTRTGDESDDLGRFIAAVASDTEAPSDIDHMATSLAALARASKRSRAPSLRKLAALAASMAILLAFSGVAMAADDASPGDPLYGIDRALENIGIGDGGAGERVAEFDELLANGATGEAYAFLGEYIESAEDPDYTTAQRHLELAVMADNPESAAALEKVEALRQFITDNRGDQGLNGEEFGQWIAERVRSEKASPAQGPNSESTGRSDHRGASTSDTSPGGEEEPGPSNGGGSSNDKDQGPASGGRGSPANPGPPADSGPNK